MEAKPPSMDRPPSSSRYVRRKRAKAPPAEIRSENSTKMATTPPPLAHFRTSFNRSRPTTMMKTSQGGGGSAVAAPTRCVQCRKKLGLASTFRCRCSGWFCASHRLPESHACKFDYKVSGRMALSKENPVVKRDKLVRL
ncbi:hypothetical protein BJ742DRAFT_843468 [Cladochytrium replicatum]|nr:hypothetical protein BJ742DRAFT_843468 [Cladochytrium replicatum]